MTTARCPRQPARSAGFTLLETVVTLIIVSLLVATLMQALSHALGLRTRILRVQSEARLDLLQEAWFRETVGAAQADLDDAMGGMEGRRDALAYATPIPLVANGMARVRWWLQDDGSGLALHYADPGTDGMVVVAGPLEGASFAYLDRAGEWHAEWSPAPDAAERLPRLVRFEAQTLRGRLYWLVPLLADPIPREQMRLDEAMGSGRGI